MVVILHPAKTLTTDGKGMSCKLMLMPCGSYQWEKVTTGKKAWSYSSRLRNLRECAFTFLHRDWIACASPCCGEAMCVIFCLLLCEVLMHWTPSPVLQSQCIYLNPIYVCGEQQIPDTNAAQVCAQSACTLAMLTALCAFLYPAFHVQLCKRPSEPLCLIPVLLLSCHAPDLPPANLCTVFVTGSREKRLGTVWESSLSSCHVS